MLRKLVYLCALCCALFALSGCFANFSDEGLYRLPKLPAEYESLETLIDALLDSGAEYAAPTSGSNLQSVQMVDLDGDGTEEAVAFLRRAGDEKPMKIHVFRANNENYEQYALIEGAANSVYSVTYTDLNGDGWREILAGSRSSADVQNLAAYSVRGGEAKLLLGTGYSRYAAYDMDADGQQELIVIRSDAENAAVADYYMWNGTEMERCSELRLSSSVSEVSRLTAGRLADGENALFVTGVTEDGDAITDILLVNEKKVQAVARSGELFRFLGLYPTDIDGDGVTEVPQPIAFPRIDPEGTVYYRIYWRRYDAAGGYSIVRDTFQDTAAGWSLTLPETWGTAIVVSRLSSPEGSAVSFTKLDGELSDHAFLTIYAFTGDNRDALARRGERIQLLRLPNIVFAAELAEDAQGLMDEALLRESFSLITAEWTTGEN